jgi:single-stranded DNA-binding protein
MNNNNFNFIIIEGNLIADPTFKSDKIKFTISSQREAFDAIEVPIYCDGKLAQVASNELKEGSKVLVSGVLTTKGVYAKELTYLKGGSNE